MLYNLRNTAEVPSQVLWEHRGTINIICGSLRRQWSMNWILKVGLNKKGRVSIQDRWYNTYKGTEL